MNNEELKPQNFEDKKETENNRESLLLKKIRGLEESVGNFGLNMKNYSMTM